MLNLKEDARCVNLEQLLIEYAQSVLNREQSRRNFFAKGGKRYNLEADRTYASYCSRCRGYEERFLNGLDNYIKSFGKIDDQMQVNGHFLFFYKKLYQYIPPTPEEQKAGKKVLLEGRSKDFLREGLLLAERAINRYPLRSIDKVRFLEHVIKNNYHKEVNGDKDQKMAISVVEKLASFNPHAITEEDFGKLYEKSLNNLSDKSGDRSKEIALFFNMFKHFERRVGLVSNETVTKYADLYFMMSDKAKSELDINILKSLATKTTSAVITAQICQEKEVLDKDAIQGIFVAYVDHVNKSGSFNQGLANQMERLAAMSFDTGEYTYKDARDIHNIIASAQISGKGRTEKSSGLSALAKIINEQIVNSDRIKGHIFGVECSKEIGKLDHEISYQDKINYVDGIFKKLKKEKSQDVKIKDLYDVLVQDGKVDKPLLLDVADAYAGMYTSKEMDRDAYNADFHEKMTRMMQSIVTNFDFTDAEVRDLTSCLAKGAEGTYAVEISSSDRDMEEYGVEAAYTERRGHEVFQNMASSISYAYSPAVERYDWYEPKSNQTKKAVSPIILKRNGGNGGNS